MGSNTYPDPVTGYQVFTEFGHKKRGKCCGNRWVREIRYDEMRCYESN